MSDELYAMSTPWLRYSKPLKELFEKLVEEVPPKFARPSLRPKVKDALAMYRRSVPLLGDIETTSNLKGLGYLIPRNVRNDAGVYFSPPGLPWTGPLRIPPTFEPKDIADLTGDDIQRYILWRLHQSHGNTPSYGILIDDLVKQPDEYILESLGHELTHHGQHLYGRGANLVDQTKYPYHARLSEILANAGAKKRVDRLLGRPRKDYSLSTILELASSRAASPRDREYLIEQVRELARYRPDLKLPMRRIRYPRQPWVIEREK